MSDIKWMDNKAATVVEYQRNVEDVGGETLLWNVNAMHRNKQSEAQGH